MSPPAAQQRVATGIEGARARARTGCRKRACVALGVMLTLTAIPAVAGTTGPWTLLAMALEDGYRPGLEELPQVTAALAGAPEEMFVAWDRQGRFLFHAIGEGHRVRIPRSLAGKLEDSTVIHNHPRGFPASARDLDTVLRYGLRRMYVAASIDGIISLAEVTPDEAVRQRRQGGGPLVQASWRPVVGANPILAIDGTRVVAAQIAYSLLGDVL